MLTLELPQLDLRYAGLRIADPSRRARLEQAIAREVASTRLSTKRRNFRNSSEGSAGFG